MDEMAEIVSDIESLLMQLKQISGGAAQAPAEGDKPEINEAMINKIMAAMKQEEEEGKEEPGEDPEKVAKSDEGPNANDTAEERVNEQGDVNEKNINEVAKAIAKILAQKPVNNPVKKSAGVNPMIQVAKALESIAARVGEQDKAISGILAGLGVSEQVLKAAPTNNTVEKSAPVVNNSEVNKTLDYLRQELGINKEQAPDRPFSLHKALTENNGAALSAMMTSKR